MPWTQRFGKAPAFGVAILLAGCRVRRFSAANAHFVAPPRPAILYVSQIPTGTAFDERARLAVSKNDTDRAGAGLCDCATPHLSTREVRQRRRAIGLLRSPAPNRIDGCLPDIAAEMRQHREGTAMRRHEPGKEQDADYPGEPAAELQAPELGNAALPGKSGGLTKTAEIKAIERPPFDLAGDVGTKAIALFHGPECIGGARLARARMRHGGNIAGYPDILLACDAQVVIGDDLARRIARQGFGAGQGLKADTGGDDGEIRGDHLAILERDMVSGDIGDASALVDLDPLPFQCLRRLVGDVVEIGAQGRQQRLARGNELHVDLAP